MPSNFPLRLALVLTVGVLLCLDSLSARAAQTVRVYDVVVDGTDPSRMFDAAMRIALVRATGRADAASDPAFATLLVEPRRYVQLFRAAPGGGTQVVFDGDAMDRAVTSSGKSLWGRLRPMVLVAMDSPAALGDAAVRKSMADAANQRGLPLQWPSDSQIDIPAGGDAADPSQLQAALAQARRAGADAMLVARGTNNLNGIWQWTLYSSGGADSWAGSAAAGVDGASDALLRVAQATATAPDIDTYVAVAGVNNLRDYAQLLRTLAGVSNARGLSVLELAAGNLLVRLTVRGGSDALSGALAAESRLALVDGVPGRLSYRWQP